LDRILVTPRSFGSGNSKPKKILERQNYKITYNNTGKHFTEKQMIKKLADKDAVIVGTDPISAKVIENASQLRVISKYGVGLDNIDLEAANKNGIMVTYTPGTNFEAVAELSIGLMFNIARNISTIDRKVREKNWLQSRGVELKGKIIGIIGTGTIGKRTAEIANCIGMKVICYDINKDKEWAEKLGAKYQSFDKLISKADFISLHIPLNSKTKYMIGKKELNKMKKSSILINTSRGGIVDLDALVEALKENCITGAGLDVFENQPPKNQEIYDLDNIVITSHIGAHTRESITKMGTFSANNLIKGLEGKKPKYTVTK